MADPMPQALPRVLIVDDSRMVRATLVKRIKDAYDVCEEGDGEAGWQRLLGDPEIQVVISDLSMPKLDGYGLLARIRASEVARIRDIPVIMISGDEDDAARHRARECGATEFITKGTGTVELSSRLDALIKLSRTRRKLEESREAVAQTAALDPESGLFTRVYLEKQGDQALSHARRHGAEVSALMIGVDRLDLLLREHGAALVEKLAARFAGMLQASVRKEDSLAQVGPCDFAIVTPSTSFASSTAFAARLCANINRAAVNYAGKTLGLSVSIGVSNNLVDRIEASEELLAKAEERMRSARLAGGNRVIGDDSLPATPPVPTVERALLLLRAGKEAEVTPHLAALTAALLPLLQLIDREYGLGVDLARLQRLEAVDKA